MLTERKITPTVCIQTILGSWNLDNVDDMIEWAEELEVDGIGFQPLQCPFWESAHEKWHENFPYFPTEQQINKGLTTLLRMKKRKHPILNSTYEINSWYTYFRNPFLLPSNFKPCKAMFQNIIVDSRGNVGFCYYKELNPIDKIGNLCRDTFDDIWKGANAVAIRKEMSLCQRSCGVLSCHKDVNL